MTSEKSDDTIRPDVADLDWVRSIAERDSELTLEWVCSVAEKHLASFWNGDEEPLVDSLRTILKKETRSNREDTYLRTVLSD